jgi:hypothetical protein
VNASTRQHTPGPWGVEGSYVHGPDGKRFLAVASDGEGQANARLIAAAPALLEALEACLPDLEHYVATHGPGPDKRLAIARAAIARAKEGGAL